MTVMAAAATRATSSGGVQRPSEAVVCMWRSVIRRRVCETATGARSPGARAGGRRRGGPGPATGAPLALHQRAVLADQQIEVVPFFVGKLEEDLLAFGVFEPLAVLLEEAVRAALAANANHQRLLIVDAAHQTFGAFGEETVRGAFEKEERRTGFELRIAAEQLAVARLQLAQVFLLLQGKVLEHLATARVLGHFCRTRVEIETAALGGDRDSQRIAREDEIRVPFRAGHRGPSGTALFAGPVDLHDTLRGGKTAGRRHFLDRCLDVRAEEFERAMATLAD